MMTSYDEIAELATQPADQQSAEDQPKGIGTARPTRRQAEAAVELLLRWAGDDPAREGLVDTPARVVRSYEEFFSGYDDNPEEMLARTFEEVEGYDDMVMLRDSSFIFGFVLFLLRLGGLVVVTTLLAIASNGDGESAALLGEGDNTTGDGDK